MPSEIPLVDRSMLWVAFEGEWPHKISELRVRTWKKERELKKQLKNMDAWIDSHDSHARHLLYIRDGKIAGAIRYCVHREMQDLPDLDNLKAANVQEQISPLAAINRLVVDPSHQGTLIGGRLAIETIRQIENTNTAAILFVGTPEAQKMAQKLGFEYIGTSISNPYLNGTVHCRVMRKLLTTSEPVFG
jgi:predicted GNAT family N-acyltransferase